MLRFFQRRETLVRYFLGFLLVVISVGMVVYLIPGSVLGGGDDADPTLASVEGHDITASAFRSQLQSEINRYSQGSEVSPQLAQMMGPQILQRMILRQALEDQAQRLGLRVTDADVAAEIRREAPALFPGGKFVGEDQYESFLQQELGKTPAEFESMVREQVLLQQLQDLVTDPVRVSPSEVAAEYQRQNEKAKFQYALLRPSDFAGQVPVSDADLQAWYNTHKAQFATPERRVLDVLLADEAKFAAQQPVSDSEVTDLYNQNHSQYVFPERIQLAHILFKTADRSASQIADERKQAEQVDQQAKSGGNFAALAKKYSQDDATLDKGGDLGWITRGQMLPAVENVAFSLQPGQVSNVIETPYGLEILKVEAHEQAHTTSLAQVRDQLVQQIKTQKAATAAQDAIEHAAAQVHTVPLDQLAKKYNLDYFQTPPITSTDPITGIGVNPDFATAAFNTTVGGVTPVTKVSQGYALGEVAKIVPPGTPPLSDVRMQVEQQYRQDKAAELARASAQQLAQQAATKGLEAAASAMHLKVKTSDFVARQGTVPDVGSIASFADALFRSKPGAVQGPVQTGDGQLVYSLVSTEQPSPAEFQAQEATLRQTMLDQKRQQVFAAYADQLEAELTKKGKLSIHQAKLQQALGVYSS
jgi:peptidyl-prolyl cis-trans isomerase D